MQAKINNYLHIDDISELLAGPAEEGIRGYGSLAIVGQWRKQIISAALAHTVRAYNRHTKTSYFYEENTVSPHFKREAIESWLRSIDYEGDLESLWPKSAIRVVRPLATQENNWKPKAREIAKEIYGGNSHLNLDRIAQKVHDEMDRRNSLGENGMTGRGDKIPSAGTIKRHALTGIKE